MEIKVVTDLFLLQNINDKKHQDTHHGLISGNLE